MKYLQIAAACAAMACAQVAAAAVPATAPATAPPATPNAAQLQAVRDLMAAMQAEKLMRTTAGASRYASDAQRQAVMDKLSKVPPAEIHQRLAAQVARLISAETALEMTKFYSSSYGQRLLHQTYNGGPSMYGVQDPKPSGAEKTQLKQPALVKARQEFALAEPAIKHEAFVLLQKLIK